MTAIPTNWLLNLRLTTPTKLCVGGTVLATAGWLGAALGDSILSLVILRTTRLTLHITLQWLGQSLGTGVGYGAIYMAAASSITGVLGGDTRIMGYSITGAAIGQVISPCAGKNSSLTFSDPQFTMSPLLEALRSQLGWRITYIIQAVISAGLGMAGSKLLKTPPAQNSAEQGQRRQQEQAPEQEQEVQVQELVQEQDRSETTLRRGYKWEGILR